LGNIRADFDGVARISVVDRLISLHDAGRHPIGGRSLVVHDKPDDLGRGRHQDSLKTGNAGGRLGCCVITIVDPKKVNT
jgi:Cu-Zn family superoxide dismutase